MNFFFSRFYNSSLSPKLERLVEDYWTDVKNKSIDHDVAQTPLPEALKILKEKEDIDLPNRIRYIPTTDCYTGDLLDSIYFFYSSGRYEVISTDQDGLLIEKKWGMI